MPDYAVSLLIQIPIVGAFMWFILERDKRAAASEEKRDIQWRQFLAEQRKQTTLAIKRLAEEIKHGRKETVQEISKLAGILSAHDMRARDAISQLTHSRRRKN